MASICFAGSLPLAGSSDLLPPASGNREGDITPGSAQPKGFHRYKTLLKTDITRKILTCLTLHIILVHTISKLRESTRCQIETIKCRIDCRCRCTRLERSDHPTYVYGFVYPSVLPSVRSSGCLYTINPLIYILDHLCICLSNQRSGNDKNTCNPSHYISLCRVKCFRR